jgi:hypothetical protein
MKNTLIALFLSLIWTSFFVEAQDKPCGKEGDPSVYIPNGFGKGDTYLKWTASQKNAYAMGFLNGMLVAPLFNAPEKCTKWLDDYAKGMSDQQVAAIITKFLNDNPGRWHEPLPVLSYSAILDAYNKEYFPP